MSIKEFHMQQQTEKAEEFITLTEELMSNV